MEEASPVETNKREPDNPSSHHDLLNLYYNKKSQDRSLWFPQTNRSNEQRTCSQDLLGDSKNKKSRDSRSIMSTPIEESEEEGGGGTDLISRLPDDALSNIISKLSTKEGACTQILSKRWQPLWSLSPLNLQVDCDLSSKEHTRINLINKILSNHKGGGRRLYLHHVCFRNLHDNSNRWFESPALDNLQELDFCYGSAHSDNLEKPLPSSTLRFSSTLHIFSLGNCHFPMDGNDSLLFPKLKQLSLQCVTISESAFQSLLSGCPKLESLLILDCDGLRLVCVTSPTIRSIGVRSSVITEVETQRLVVRDTPCLERLLTFPPKGPTMIQVFGAPRLKVMGYLSRDIGKLEIGSKIFKRMISWSSRASICTLKVLVVMCTDPNLGVVLQLLRCFPCLETLYIMFSVPRINTRNNVWYGSNLLEPIYCLHHHLKKIIIRGYKGKQSDINFANFFIINAKVLHKMTIGVPRKQSDKWMANQLLELHLDYKASKNAQVQFMHYYLLTDMNFQKRTHDLSVSDPFDA